MDVLGYLSNESVISGVIGALAGSASAWILQVFCEHRRQRRDERRAVIVELTTLAFEFVALLEEIDAGSGEGSQRHRFPQLTRVAGALVALQLRAWAAFSHCREQAAVTRLVSRVGVICNRIKRESAAEDMSLMVRWFENAQKEVLNVCTPSAQMPTKISGRFPVWIGFRRATYEDKRLLSTVDEPPPWEFGIRLNLQELPAPADLERARANLASDFASLRCAKHRQRLHILLEGPTLDGARPSFVVCCEEFRKMAMRALESTKNMRS